MKADTQKITTLLKDHSRAVAEIAELKNLQTSLTQGLESIINTVDLGDEKGLAAISIEQTRLSLLPLRIAAIEQSIPVLEAGLLAACHEFISTTVGPTIRKLRESTVAKVRAELKPHFPNPVVLDHRVAESNSIDELDALSYQVSLQDVPTGGVLSYAQRILGVWEQVAAIESK